MQDRLLTKEEFLEKLRTDKEFNSIYGRKHITEGKMVLPPCHYGFQVYTRELSLEERYVMYFEKLDHTMVPLDIKIPNIHQYFTELNIPTRAISLMWNQRSVDTFLGLPFNIASYGLLLEIIAKEVNMVPDELIGNLGDTHLYLNHIEQAKEQIGRTSFELPTLEIEGDEPSIIEKTKYWRPGDFVIKNYQSHPTIKAPLSN
jgi:thymidylate synthase